MPTIIKGQPPSTEIRQRLADEGRPVLVAFSTGKDSVAATLALHDAGIETVPVYMYGIPGLQFVEETLSLMEDQFGTRIARYPHPSLWRKLTNLVLQPPERCSIIEATGAVEYDYEELWDTIREDQGLPMDTWVADGVRAADSIMRRASFTRHGIIKPSSRKVSPIADWLKAEVMGCIESHGIRLGRDYEWFGRSFDGIDPRFLGPIRDNAPEDYARILEWFPLADLQFMREDMRARSEAKSGDE